MQMWLWFAFFASFAVKMPMWPVHTWLPDAHVEAPTAGSVILAGILLKMGGYGFLRFSLPMFASASETFAPFVFTLSIVAIIYTSLVALAQEDMKKLIAYSSVAHMGFVTMGIFTLTHQGIEGGIYQMLSHGVVSGALFLCVGVVYDRMHTREIAAYGGLVERMPVYAACFMVFTLANVGLPGTGGFVGEFLTMLGAFQVNTWVAIFAATGVILSAAYALYLYRRIIFGALVKPRATDDPGSVPARDRHPRAAGRHHDRHGHLSQADLRRDLGLGREPDPSTPNRACRRPCAETRIRWRQEDRAMTAQHDTHTILLPELILAVSGMALLILGVFRGDECASAFSRCLSSSRWLRPAWSRSSAEAPPARAFDGAFVADSFARFAKLLILLGSAPPLSDVARAFCVHEKIARFEFPVLVLFATVGMMLMVSA